MARRFRSGLLSLLLLVSLVPALPAGADHTPDPTGVAIAGSLQDELGCPGDWQPDCAATELGYDGDDGVWQGTFAVPAGSWEYKAALNDSWAENYGAGGVLDGPNIGLSLGAATDVKFYYDHETHWVTDNVNSVIAVAAGSFQAQLGCPGDWQPWCLQSWLQDPDGDGVYTYTTGGIAPGSYEMKVALDEAWDTAYPASNLPFSVGTDEAVSFSYDSATNDVTVTTGPLNPPPTVAIVGSLQDELGCPGDWQPDCPATELAYDGEDDVFQAVFTVPAGSFEYKAALNDSWDENYGAGGIPDGPNIPLAATGDPIKFYYDHESHWVTDDVNSVIAVAAGSFQDELGCAAEWQPSCLRTWLQDLDGDDVYEFTTDQIPAGNYEFKIALAEAWDTAYPGSNVAISVGDGDPVTITFDATTTEVTAQIGGGLEPGDELLVGAPARPVEDDFTYFVLPDRFANADPSNDTGGDSSGDPLVNGFLPTDKGFYHGGDIAGLQAKLDYLQGLGVTAIWMTPQFTNRWVQGDGTIGGSSAAYHGYWQIDYTQIDPHFGTNAEMQALIADAHARGMKVYFDVVVNHTGDVITYEEGVFTYRNKTDFPYVDADGVPFDDREYAGTGTFPVLDPATSFPYTPTFADPGDAAVKDPAWLNDPIYYHNRGNSTFAGENSLYGDFFGLDDLFTEHPDVVSGMIQVHQDMITEFGIDGFRVDTVKHVNGEFWEAWVPSILAHADAQGISDFALFGEIFGETPGFRSDYMKDIGFPAVLDFGFDGAAKGFAAYSSPTDALASFFTEDDYFTDADSSAAYLRKFIGNHDIGRVGRDIQTGNPGASDSELVDRAVLAQSLNFLTRGLPIVYYGDEQGFTGDGGDKDARQDMMPSVVGSYNDDVLIGTTATTAGDNFDPTHVLYQSIADLAALRAAHPALQTGAQIVRYGESTAGTFAFSRIERDERIEYVVVLNNSEADDAATVTTASPGATFTEIYPGAGPDVVADADGAVTVTTGALSATVYMADGPIAATTGTPTIGITAPADGAEVIGNVEVAANVGGAGYAEVSFAVSIDGSDYERIGTDDAPPYRVFYDVSGLAPGSAVSFRAIVTDGIDPLNADQVDVIVGEEEPPPPPGAFDYAVIHYLRDDGDYGDHTTGNYNDFWGLHLWGDIDETIEWTSPKPFLGEDEYGRFAWVKLAPGATNVGFIVHRGDVKDGTDADRFFNPSETPEIWLKQNDGTTYTSQAAAQGYATIRYHRDDGDYGTPSPDYTTFWGLHLWGDAIAPGVGTEWTSPRAPDGIDDYGAYWDIPLADADLPLNFILHRGDTKDPGPDESFVPAEIPTVWKQSGDEALYPTRGAAEGYATIRYHRADGDYGDYASDDFNDFWGLHVWDGAASPNPSWQEPVKPVAFDIFGPIFEVALMDGAPQLAYIIHRGDNKDPGPDQFLTFDPWGYEVWQLEGEHPSEPTQPHYVLPILGEGAAAGNIDEQRAYWVDADSIVWAAGGTPAVDYELCHAPTGGMSLGPVEIEGGTCIPLGLGAAFPAGVDGFRHLAGLPTLTIPAASLGDVPAILTGQVAVQAIADGTRVDATGLQIPGALDDLYATDVPLGVDWNGTVPTLRLWAPTAKSVTLHVFDDADPATTSVTTPMVWGGASGTWSLTGDASWNGKYYLYEVEVYVHATGQVEHNLVTDPYSFSLSMNSARSQIVDLADPALAPSDWAATVKPALVNPEDIVLYELHVRDFSVSDPMVPDELEGTFKAFTLEDTYGTDHLEALADAGLTHVHLLPAFDIATINEDRTQWQSPDPAVLETYPPDSDQQQAAVTATEDLDGFNWGYDPWHYTVPEGSYSTNPNGPARIVEFREMVQALNEDGLRVVMDVVYNHTNASGQAEKSVLDRIVPGYYHRLNDKGVVETSTCCANTATEHAMMERLMIDSVVTWARDYKVDGFRFDLMGHHSLQNMLDLRAALDTLTLDDDGVDGAAIYLYGEGWNFGEVANDARFIQATQLNLGGTGIGSFSDRLRDAVRGGGPFDGGDDLARRQGFINGLYYDFNSYNSGAPGELATLLLYQDQIRVGLAGNLADYEFIDRNGNLVAGSQVDYNGQPAGYTDDPQENIIYVSAHDNQTLFDISQYKHPDGTSTADRTRAQNVGLSTVLLAQGVPFVHAGSEILRSKSLDRDSYNSGDWFNTLDFTYQDTNWGVGLPVAGKNQDNWYLMQPLLADPAVEPMPGDIAAALAHTKEMLQIRDGSPLFRLASADDVAARVGFHNTGPTQVPGLIVMSISDLVGDDLDETADSMWVLFNANDAAISFTVGDLAGMDDVVLHPVQATSADPIVRTATFDATSGEFSVPARTTAVFVQLQDQPPTVVAKLKPIKVGYKNGTFRVRYSCTDDRDPDPTIEIAELNGIPVPDGTKVKLKTRDYTRYEWADGILIVWAPSFELVVRCTDDAGNTTTVTVTPAFLSKEDGPM